VLTQINRTAYIRSVASNGNWRLESLGTLWFAPIGFIDMTYSGSWIQWLLAKSLTCILKAGILHWHCREKNCVNSQYIRECACNKAYAVKYVFVHV